MEGTERKPEHECYIFKWHWHFFKASLGFLWLGGFLWLIIKGYSCKGKILTKNDQAAVIGTVGEEKGRERLNTILINIQADCRTRKVWLKGAEKSNLKKNPPQQDPMHPIHGVEILNISSQGTDCPEQRAQSWGGTHAVCSHQGAMPVSLCTPVRSKRRGGRRIASANKSLY